MLIAILITIPSLSGALSVATAQQPPATPATPVTPLMRIKLERSKAILEGLTLEDYDKIAANARALKLLSTEAGWNVIQTEEYESQSADFRRSADLIIEAAAGRDINRATLGYVAMTVRCVECHSYIRKHNVQVLRQKPGLSPQ